MSKSILMTALFLGLGMIILQVPSANAATTTTQAGQPIIERQQAPDSATLTLGYPKPSLGFRWSVGDERNRVTFTPAPGFLVTLGVSLAMFMAIPVVRLGRAA